jgi:hypothetical protein
VEIKNEAEEVVVSAGGGSGDGCAAPSLPQKLVSAAAVSSGKRGIPALMSEKCIMHLTKIEHLIHLSDL